MKQNGVVCKQGPALLLFIFRFEYLISGPKSYRDFRETGLWSAEREVVLLNFWGWIISILSVVYVLKEDAPQTAKP